MMNRANNVGPSSKNFVLVAWQDSDVVDQIKDKSFAGKLLNKGFFFKIKRYLNVSTNFCYYT